MAITIARFNKLYTENPSDYVLDPSVLSILSFIEKNIDIPDYDRVPVQPSVSTWKKHEKKQNKKKEPSPDDWELMRNFKSTKFEIKTGIDKTINELRNKLNNIAESTYDKHRTGILEIINEFISDNEDEDDFEENITKMATTIFDISSRSKFNSALYARLYADFIELHSIFGSIIESNVKVVEESFYKIVYVDPNVDYDGFCEYTKQNEHRLSMTLFYANLMKQNVVDQTIILSLIQLFILYIESEMKQENKTAILENIAENVFVMISSTMNELKIHDDWKHVVDKVATLSGYKNKMFPSLSNRIIFKFMDIRDLIKKNN
jgi:flavodoxin